MDTAWNDEYFTVQEIADHLKLNQQTVRNWIDQGRLPAVRIGRRVRVRRADLDRILTQGMTNPPEPEPEPEPETLAPAEAIDQLSDARERARRLLGRRSAARRAELASGLQDLTDAVTATLETLAHGSSDPTSNAPEPAA